MTFRERTLDWKPRFDERSRSFPVSAVTRTAIRRRNKVWRVGPILDQGSEGACVGFGWAAEALSTPIAVRLEWMKADVDRNPGRFALNIYRRARQIDEWEGEDYDGTSVLAGAKSMKELGLLREYRWAFNVEQVTDAILTKGPVVLGIPWFDSMYDAPNGILTVDDLLAGGHCILAVGYVLMDSTIKLPDGTKIKNTFGEDAVILQNSWGPEWGINGLALIRKSDLADLLNDNGEACVATSRSYGRFKINL